MLPIRAAMSQNGKSTLKSTMLLVVAAAAVIYFVSSSLKQWEQAQDEYNEVQGRGFPYDN